MNRRKHLLEKIAVAADLSAEPIPKQTLVEIAGERRVLIENHFGVIGYGTQKICVKVRYGNIVIGGNHLELARMTKEQLVVIGEIKEILLCKGGI